MLSRQTKFKDAQTNKEFDNVYSQMQQVQADAQKPRSVVTVGGDLQAETMDEGKIYIAPYSSDPGIWIKVNGMQKKLLAL